MTISNQKSFSLVELSLLMTVIATIAAGYIFIGSAPLNDNVAKINQTYKKMIEIDQSIKNFFYKYNRLPCPAYNRASFGSISNISYDTLSYNIAFDNEYMANTTNSPNNRGAECISQIGSVPTKALNLPPSYMLDAWGNKFNFHVSTSLCGNIFTGNNSATPPIQVTCNANTFATNTANLIVNTPSATVNNAAYVLVSAGVNSYGAYNSAGVYSSVSPNLSEVSNDASKSASSLTYNKYVMSSNFDDLVIFATKSQMIANNHMPSNRVTISNTCKNNSNYMNLMTSANLTELRNKMTIIQNFDTALLDMMWVLQEACYTTNTSSKKCPINGTYDSTNNICSY